MAASRHGQRQDFKLSHLSFSLLRFGGFPAWAATRSLSISRLSLPLSCLLFYFIFFFCFSVWSLESLNCWVYIFRLNHFFFFFFLRFTCELAGWVTGTQFWRGLKLQSKGAQFFFFFWLKINLLKKKIWSRGPTCVRPWVRMKIENRDNSLSFLFIGGKIE